MRFKVMSKSMKALVLAGVLSIAASAAAQAGGHSTSGDFHANAAPAGGTARSGQIPRFWHPVLAGGRITGSEFHASAAPACDTDKCPVLAADGPPGSLGDKNGRAELVIDIHSMMAGGGKVGSDFHASALPACDAGKCQMLAGDGGPGSPGDDNGRSMASNTADGRLLILAASRPSS